MLKQVIAGVATLVWCASAALVAAQVQPASESYQWYGELVTFDGAARSVTVKAGFVDRYAATDVTRFNAGDRVLLVWSATGLGIRRIAPSAESPKAGDRFLMQAELVSTETLNPTNQNHYVTFRLSVPDSSIGTLKGMKPGEWIAVTSPVSPSSSSVVSLRRYATAPSK
jgi:hypothetical protein